ncbi:MAG: biotin/lipoyl-binding protein [Firmicutes bacterium]|nr:biotin/lipoyl-binding protein [Alicyclobacillaceae bacterium]MCL6498180.1 biotin/lipoyl-binding protein [Bacillota bacterium]
MARRRYRVRVNGQVFEVEVEPLESVETEPSGAPPATDTVPLPQPPQAAQAGPVVPSGATTVTSPLPGVVLEVKVAVGETVAAGQLLVLLEAMKMENEIVAPRQGRVAAVLVTPGAAVSAGDALVTLD